MKHLALMTAALCLAASAAQAMTISNLDMKPHAVVFESTPGSKVVRTLEPGESTHVMQSGGEVYIEGSKLRLRPYANDALVIWPQGNLQIQMRRKIGGQGVF